MLRHILQGEKPFLALLSANGVLASVRKFFVGHQPELSALLTVLQILVAVVTLIHFARKYVHYLTESAEAARAAIFNAEQKAKTVLSEAADAAKQKLSNEREPQ